LQNIIESTINKIDNLEIGKLKRNFVTNSSCGVCGKTSLDSLEIIKTEKLKLSYPQIKEKVILKSPKLLINEQSEFAKTGGIHASALIDENGKVIAIREDVGRHNALDKLIGYTITNDLLNPKKQFIACSGRLNFELVQKGLMANIGVMAGVGAPTSLAIDLAKRFDMTLLGFVKEDSFNMYTNKSRILLSN
jgi:FdhD protein